MIARFINTFAPCRDSLFSVTSESAGEPYSRANDVVVGIRTLLQVNSDVSDKLGVWLLRDDASKSFSIRGLRNVECQRCASLGDGNESVDEGKLVVTRKPKM